MSTLYDILFEDTHNPKKKKVKSGDNIISAVAFLAGAFLVDAIANRRERNLDMKRKLKFFTPTITENFWGKHITWTFRQKPLEDSQVDEIFKNMFQ